MQPILHLTLPIKKIKGAARQHYGDDDGDVWYVNRPLRIDASPPGIKFID